MGIFSSFKTNWTKAGAVSVLRTSFITVHKASGLVIDNPDRLAQRLVDDLYALGPEWLNKRIHPKPPKHELIALGALMIQLRNDDIDYETFLGYSFSYYILLREVIVTNSASQATVLDSMLVDTAFDFILSTVEAIESFPEEFRERLGSLYQTYARDWKA